VPDDRWRTWLPELRRGDKLAQLNLVEAYFDYIFRALLRGAMDLNSHYMAPLSVDEIKSLVEELTDVAFETAIATMDEYDETKGAALPTWIYNKGHARRKGIVDKEIRRASKETTRLDEEDDEQHPRVGLAKALRSLGIDAEDEAMANLAAQDLREKVDSVMNAMSRQARQALVLRYMTAYPVGGSVANVVRTTGKTPDAVTSMVKRASKEFRRLWEDQYGVPPFSD